MRRVDYVANRSSDEKISFKSLLNIYEVGSIPAQRQWSVKPG